MNWKKALLIGAAACGTTLIGVLFGRTHTANSLPCISCDWTAEASRHAMQRQAVELGARQSIYV